MRDLAPRAAAVTSADLNMLLLYHDRQFVELAYRLLLKREPDPEGLSHYVGKLRNGESRRDVAFLIGTSAEAKDTGVDQSLFDSHRKWRLIERAPVIGAIVLGAVLLFRIRYVVREFRRMQNAVYGGLAAVRRPGE